MQNEHANAIKDSHKKTRDMVNAWKEDHFSETYVNSIKARLIKTNDHLGRLREIPKEIPDVLIGFIENNIKLLTNCLKEANNQLEEIDLLEYPDQIRKLKSVQTPVKSIGESMKELGRMSSAILEKTTHEDAEGPIPENKEGIELASLFKKTVGRIERMRKKQYEHMIPKIMPPEFKDMEDMINAKERNPKDVFEMITSHSEMISEGQYQTREVAAWLIGCIQLIDKIKSVKKEDQDLAKNAIEGMRNVIIQLKYKHPLEMDLDRHQKALKKVLDSWKIL